MVTAREAFKLGFLQRCADEGLLPEQIEARIKRASVFVKASADPNMLHDMVNMLHSKIKDSGKLGIGLATGAAVGLPLLAGYGAGKAYRGLQGDLLTPEDVQKQELINEMKSLTAKSQSSQSRALGL